MKTDVGRLPQLLNRPDVLEASELSQFTLERATTKKAAVAQAKRLQDAMEIVSAAASGRGRHASFCQCHRQYYPPPPPFRLEAPTKSLAAMHVLARTEECALHRGGLVISFSPKDQSSQSFSRCGRRGCRIP